MGSASVLIVEDEAIVSEDIARKLRNLGYDIAGTTATGEEAIQIASRVHPSLVLMDIRLDGAMDGVTAADIIQRTCPVPVVFLTAHSDKTTVQRLRQTEAFGYILKPFDDRELHTQIEIALHRHAAEQRLHDSQARLATFVAATFEGVIETEAGRILDCNVQFAQMLGYSPDELPGMEIACLIAPEDRDRVMANILQEQVSISEHNMIRKDGSRIIVEAHGRPASSGQLITAIRDITEQKRRENKLQQLNRTLTALNHCSAARMRATDEISYLQEVCKIIVMDCGHTMAWIGYAENDDAKSIRAVASAGFETGYLETLNLTYADSERGRGPTGTTIRTGLINTCQNMLTDPRFIPWREEALKRGYASSIVLPLMAEGRCFGAINIYNRQPDPFSQEEIDLLTELTGDLAFGITTLWMRVERDRANDALQHTLDTLEQQVQERTADLRSANESLIREMEERGWVEAALRESQEKLTASNETLTMVIDGITDPLIMLDATSRIKKLNRAAKDYYGLSGEQDAAGKLCFEVFRQRSDPCEGCEYPLSGIQGFFGSYERKGIIDPDRIEQVFVYPVKDASGTPVATVVRIADITQVRLLDRQIIQSEKLASLGMLVSGIAHEINNPNNFIFFNIPILRSYLEFLLPIVDKHAAAHPQLEVFGRSYPDFREDCFKLLDNLEHGSTRINQIVRNLRDFSRERGMGEKRRVDVKQVVDKAVSLCSWRIRNSVKTFESLIPEGIPAILADPLALEQVLVNLLINAVQSADKDDAWVRLTITASDEPADEVIIEVKDNGCGMDMETKRKIFNPFFTTKAAGTGTGLGLFITHRLVEEMGGRIEVQSETGKGSIFQIRMKTAQS
jgi:PAS domain S-box-containing protein